MSDTSAHAGPLALFALAAAPALTLAGSLAQASPEAHDTTSELASIAAHSARYQVAGFIGFLAVVLWVPALLGLARPLWRTRPRLAAVGLGMSVTGLMALASLMGSGPVSQAMAASPDRAAMVNVTDAYEALPLTTAWMVLMVLGFSLGPIVLGVGLWRDGRSWAVPALLLTGLVVQMMDAGRWPLALGYALTTAGLVVAGSGAARPRRTPAATAPDRRAAGAR